MPTRSTRTRSTCEGCDAPGAPRPGFRQPDLTVFLAVDPAEAQRRVDLRGRDHEELAYLQAADAAYRSLPEWSTFTVVDADRPAERVLDDVRRLVEDMESPPGRR